MFVTPAPPCRCRQHSYQTDVTSEADFVRAAPTPADVEALTRRLFFGNHDVRRFRIVMMMGGPRKGWRSHPEKGQDAVS